MSQPYRIFKSDKVEMLPNIEWFEDYEFKVYLNPNDATDFFIDYKKRSILSRFNGLRNALKNNKHTIREYQEYNPSKDLL